MNIDDYIEEFEKIISTSAIAASYNLSIDRKTDEIAFIVGKIYFRDGSILDFKEFAEARETCKDACIKI